MSRRRFTCSYSGSRSGRKSCFHNGRARVRKVSAFRYRARILTRRVNCF